MATIREIEDAYRHVDAALKALKDARRAVDTARAGGTQKPAVAYLLGAMHGRAAIAQENLEVLASFLLEYRFDIEEAAP